ncbi:DUF1064 domain-containing protein [Cohnella nanjingensis]|uniref:DUF1064 domain-containing protein n=1 Tax=Cohnella nanjingensis TaxID=1387779 RepID=A0A7X0VG01_9BACL|nr:DUF1064 domain-containing protein [Cohnella nanjingensis]MBB6672610.1 DUF1064 domain-containing protein [Cohnella nanjingensis]
MLRIKTRTSKYGARHVIADGRRFDSRAEYRYYEQLKLRLRAKDIASFECQVRYTILDPYKHPTTGRKVQGIVYVADFVVTHLDGSHEVIDVKGVRTEAYRNKKKMFESKYGIEIKEVKA